MSERGRQLRISHSALFYLVPGIVRAGFVVGVMPLTTMLLEPADYGLFAIATVFTQLAVAIALSGVEYLVYSSYRTSSMSERGHLVTTAFVYSLVIAGVGAVLLREVWPWASSFVGFSDKAPQELSWIIPLMVIGALPWAFAIMLVTVQGRARLYAACTVSETIVSVGALLIALFGLGLGPLSLFIGALGGMAVSSVFGGSVIVKFLGSPPRWVWLARLWRTVPASLLDTAMQRGFEFAERTSVAAAGGLHQAGLYTHSQQYRGMIGLIVKAIARALWPVSLDEARMPAQAYPQTRQAWDLVYIVLGAGGIVFVAIGEPLIALLTNGKFIGAYPFVTLWIVYIIIQNTGKPLMAILHVHPDAGPALRMLSAVSFGASIVALVVLVDMIGVYGALAIALGQVCIYRVGLVFLARRYERVKNLDGVAYVAVAFVVGAILLHTEFPNQTVVDMSVFGVLLTVFLGAHRRRLRKVYIMLVPNLRPTRL